MFTANYPADGPSLVGTTFIYHGRYRQHDGQRVRVTQRDYLTGGWLVETETGAAAWAMSRAAIAAAEAE